MNLLGRVRHRLRSNALAVQLQIIGRGRRALGKVRRGDA